MGAMFGIAIAGGALKVSIWGRRVYTLGISAVQGLRSGGIFGIEDWELFGVGI